MRDNPLIPNLVENDPAPVRVEISVPVWQAALLLCWNVPPELCGSTLAERVEFAVDNCALGLSHGEADRTRVSEYRALNPSYVDDQDDEIPF